MDILSLNKIMPFEEALALMAEVEGFEPIEFYTDGKPDLYKIMTARKSRMIRSIVVDNEKKIISFKIRGDNSGTIYLIKDERGSTKIGHAENMKRRFSQISMSNSGKVRLYYSRIVKDRKALEKILHIEFSAKRIKGEWFDLSSDDLEKAKSIIDNY
jgi:hypothetical protein